MDEDFNQAFTFEDEFNIYSDGDDDTEVDLMEVVDHDVAIGQRRSSSILVGGSVHDSGDSYPGEDSSRLSYMEYGGDDEGLHSSDAFDSDRASSLSNGGGRVYEIDLKSESEHDDDEDDGMRPSSSKRGFQSRYGAAGAGVAAAGGMSGLRRTSVASGSSYDSMEEGSLFEDAMQPPTSEVSLDIEQMWRQEEYDAIAAEHQRIAYDIVHNRSDRGEDSSFYLNMAEDYAGNPAKDPPKPSSDLSFGLDQMATESIKPSSELSIGLEGIMRGGQQEREQAVLLDIFGEHESGRTSATTSTGTGSSGSSRTVKARGGNGALLAVGGAATGMALAGGHEVADDGYLRTIRFAEHTTVIGEGDEESYEQSLTFLDVYGQEDLEGEASQASISLGSYTGGLAALHNSAESLESIRIGGDDDDNASFVSASSGDDSEDDEEKKIKRQMLWALGGIGAMAFFGWAGKKIMEKIFKSDDPDVGGDTYGLDNAVTANDIATSAASGDGGTTIATTGTTAAAGGDGGASAAAFNASASQSQSQIGFAYVGQGNAAPMTGAETQVMQSMAVSAANNAAASADATSSGMTAFVAGAGATAAVAASATTATIVTISVVGAAGITAGVATVATEALNPKTNAEVVPCPLDLGDADA
ncbi:MAG: hypothetical protein SGILL_003830, partial [Bacillariaceae sp.]